MRTGFYIVGILKGYKSSSFTNRETGEVKDRHNMGVQLQEPDGYGGYQFPSNIPNCLRLVV